MSRSHETSFISLPTISSQNIPQVMNKIKGIIGCDFTSSISNSNLVNNLQNILDEMENLKPNLDSSERGVMVSLQILLNNLRSDIPIIESTLNNFNQAEELQRLADDHLKYIRKKIKDKNTNLVKLWDEDFHIDQRICYLEHELQIARNKKADISEALDMEMASFWEMDAESKKADAENSHLLVELLVMKKEVNGVIVKRNNLEEAWKGIQSLFDL
ncbi:hypothetical protein MTR_1g033660 [Medicago truncatula]|uniref:Uncharacterized protein n=1 Tax=Medicago truncatula TaxID=3880 RepID=A0A072VGH8_MEDTR|nr:hypothetical protein MTR_1g033660 [Medicago truncatula]